MKEAERKGRENVATANDRKRERNRNYNTEACVVCSLSGVFFIAPTTMHVYVRTLWSRASHVSFARLLPKSRQTRVPRDKVMNTGRQFSQLLQQARVYLFLSFSRRVLSSLSFCQFRMSNDHPAAFRILILILLVTLV